VLGSPARVERMNTQPVSQFVDTSLLSHQELLPPTLAPVRAASYVQPTSIIQTDMDRLLQKQT
jgi:hypothetical protein